MRNLILMAGIPGSGKSTWCEEYKKTHENVFVIDTDETRKQITGSYLVFPDRMEVIYDEMIRQSNEIFAKYPDCTVIEDSIFLEDYRRKYYMDRLKGYDHSLLFMIKMHDYSICYERNKMRIKDKWVPDEVIDNMINIYADPSPEVSRLFDEIKIEYWN